ncbi:MAG TPA: hypothetical protein VGS11_09945 [Candidatus Bathyarchaeia archaeon]|nr:hypothetical protein [Candidatus Bathyarchaeia archaeon]
MAETRPRISEQSNRRVQAYNVLEAILQQHSAGDPRACARIQNAFSAMRAEKRDTSPSQRACEPQGYPLASGLVDRRRVLNCTDDATPLVSTIAQGNVL